MCTCSKSHHECGKVTRTGKRARVDKRKGQRVTEARKAQMLAVGERRIVVPASIFPAVTLAVAAVRHDPACAAAVNESIAAVFTDGMGHEERTWVLRVVEKLAQLDNLPYEWQGVWQDIQRRQISSGASSFTTLRGKTE
jgi:hypothetical protein